MGRGVFVPLHRGQWKGLAEQEDGVDPPAGVNEGGVNAGATSEVLVFPAVLGTTSGTQGI